MTIRENTSLVVTQRMYADNTEMGKVRITTNDLVCPSNIQLASANYYVYKNIKIELLTENVLDRQVCMTSDESRKVDLNVIVLI